MPGKGAGGFSPGTSFARDRLTDTPADWMEGCRAASWCLPGVLHYSKFFLRLEPIGLELVAQAARQAGHAVQLIDLQVEDHRAYFRTLEAWRPDVIAFSCNYLPHVPEIADLA